MLRAHSRPDARLGLLVVVLALLPGVLGLVAAGAAGEPTSALVVTEAAGVCSVAALQGLDRRAVEAPSTLALAPRTDTHAAPLAPRAVECDDRGPAWAASVSAPCAPLALRL